MTVPPVPSFASPTDGEVVHLVNGALPYTIEPGSFPWSADQMEGDLLGWWREDEGLYQDAAKATAVSADADPVGAWAPKGGTHAQDITQATGGSKPTYRTNQFNGHPAIYFDGGDWLQGAYSSTLTVQPTVLMVMRVVTVANSRYAFAAGASGGRLETRMDPLNASWWMYAGGIHRPGHDPDTSLHAYEFLFEGASSNLTVDGTAGTAGDAGAGLPSGFTLGAYRDGTLNGEIYVSEVIVCDPTATDLTNFRSYAQTRYGTP